ncbi:MAG: M1 family aminopeptidase [Candidatus Bipolaricaulota bacterium]|nr:M1 family aminopeptidase [Candidatus Bipolaricaulota bacterium]MDW8126382.1 M1 family aminopeptidase [Candidatus Bipolaricaulota bacterium]
MKTAAFLLAIWVGFHSFSAPISYIMRVSVEESGAFQGEVTLNIAGLLGVGELLFRLYPNHFGHLLRVEEARSEGKSLPLDAVEPTVLVVQLPSELPQTASLHLRFSGVLPRELLGYGIFAHTARAMIMSQFYPILAPWEGEWLLHPTFPFGDNLVAEAADYLVFLQVPSGWVPVASGEERKTGWNTWQINGENLREFCLVLVREYTGLVDRWADVEIRVFFPFGFDQAGKRALAIAKEALPLLTARLGSFPFPDVDLIAAPLSGAGGVEYPRLILINQDYALDPYTDFFAEIVVHELAHQWWYGEVGTDQVAEPWLDEALATYTSSLYFEVQGELEQKVREWQDRFLQAKKLNPQASVGSGLWEFLGRSGYAGYVYAGGALLLHEVRSSLGDEIFFSILRNFREKYRWRIARACDFLGLLAEELGPLFSALALEYFGDQPQCQTEPTGSVNPR